MQALVEKSPRDEITLNYDSLNPFVICAKTLTPIYKGTPHVECPYCHASYQPTFQGTVCTVCDLAKIGQSVSGLKVIN